MKFLQIALWILVLVPTGSVAETDGNEFLEMMQHPKGRDATQPFIDDVWARWNNGLFCIPEKNIQDATHAVVLEYLETHPEVLFRPRRYVIVQALRTGFPCVKGDESQ